MNRRDFLSASLVTLAVGGSLTGCRSTGDALDFDLTGGGSGQGQPGAPAATVKLTPPFTVQASCTLTEDYLLVDPRATSSADDEVAAFQLADGSVHLLVLTTDPSTKVGTLTHLRPDATQPGGWGSDLVPTAGSVLDFAVANDPESPGSSVTLYYRTSTGVSILACQDGTTWSPAGAQLPWHAPVQITYAGLFESIATLAYSYDPAQHTVSFRLSDQEDVPQVGVLTGLDASITGNLGMSLESRRGVQFRIVAASSGHKIYSYLTPQQQGGGAVGAPVVTDLSQTVPGLRSSIDTVVAINSFLGDTFVVVRGSDGSLSSFTQGSDLTPIWDASLHGAVDRVDSVQLAGNGDPTLDLFVTSSSSLSVVHQVSPGAASPAFAPPVPLQPGVAQVGVATAPKPDGSRTLVTVDPEGVVAVLHQPASDQAWSSQPVLLPAEEHQQVDTYRVQLSVTDGNGIPAVGVPLQITAGTGVLALLDAGGSAVLGSTATSVTTDGFGRVVLVIPANGLGTADLTVGGDSVTTTTVTPASAVHDFLAGGAPLNYADNTFTSASLQAATIGTDGRQLAPDLSADDASTAVGLITSAMGTATGTAALKGSERTLRLGRTSGSPPVIRVGTLDLDVTSFDHDLWHAIKTGAAKVVAVATDAATAVISVTVKLAEWGEQVLTAAVGTVEGAVNAAHSIFNHIAAAIGDVISWLRADITQLLADTATLANLMYDWMAAAPEYLASAAKSFRGQVDSYLTGVESRLQDGLSSPAVPTGTLAGLAASRPAALRGSRNLTGSALGVDPGLFTGNSHASWLLHKVEHLFADAFAPSSSTELQQAWGALESVLTGATDEFRQAITNLWDQLVHASDSAGDPQGVKGVDIGTLVTQIRETVLEALLTLTRTAADAVLNLVAAAASALTDGILTQTLASLPLIGPLLAETSIGQVTFGKLVCLLVAFPVTVVYRLTHPRGAGLVPASVGRGLLGADDSRGTTLRWVAVGSQALWAFVDVFLEANEIENELSQCFDTLVPLLIGVATYPGVPASDGGTAYPFTTEISLKGTGEDMLFAEWLFGFLPPLLSVVTILLPGKQKSFRKIGVGPLVLSGVGGLTLVYGIVANAIATVSGGAWAATILGGITVAAAILGDEKVKEESEGLSLVAKMVIDYFGGMGAAVGMAAD